jgi:hypothetical protein
MVAMQDIERIVRDALSAHVSSSRVRRILVAPYVNSVEQEGLRITIVIAEDDPLPGDGSTLLDILLEVSDRLSAAGELRLPTLSYASEEELAHSGDPDI